MMVNDSTEQEQVVQVVQVGRPRWQAVGQPVAHRCHCCGQAGPFAWVAYRQGMAGMKEPLGWLCLDCLINGESQEAFVLWAMSSDAQAHFLLYPGTSVEETYDVVLNDEQVVVAA